MAEGLFLNRRSALGGTLLAGAALNAPANALDWPLEVRRGKIHVAGLGVFYEIHERADADERRPLVLLHGGVMTIETAFPPAFMASFPRRRTIIAIEQQGHGHTGDRLDAPMTIDRMVEDTAEVLKQLQTSPVDLFGHSLGGIIGTGLAVRHPTLVNSLTSAGAPFSLVGFREEIRAMHLDPGYVPPESFLPLLPTEPQFEAWHASFRRSAPDAEAFSSILERLNAMLSSWSGWTAEDLVRLRAPALIVVGDNDYVTVDHAVEMANTLTMGQLAVLPRTTHLDLLGRSDWIASMMAHMLATPE